LGQVGLDPGPQPRQRLAERQHPAVLRLVAGLAPLRVVAVLLASPRVAAGGLQVTVGNGTDPYVHVRGWDRQAPDPKQGRLVAHGATVRPDVAEASTSPAAANPRRPVADVA